MNKIDWRGGGSKNRSLGQTQKKLLILYDESYFETLLVSFVLWLLIYFVFQKHDSSRQK